MSGVVRFVRVIRTTHKPIVLWKLCSKKKAAIGFSSGDENFTGISSLTKTKISPPFWFQSILKGDA